MKLYCRKFLCIFFCFIIAGFVFAKDIELPDVTTVITGGSEQVGADALPGFSDALSGGKKQGSGDIDPVLPEVREVEPEEPVQQVVVQPEKKLYLEGLIGGGYPTWFKGDISLALNPDENPFRVKLFHDSAIGYAMHSLTDGYSDRLTKISLEKSYRKNNFSWNAGGAFQTAADGLQGNVISNGEKISLLNRDTYKANGNICYEFSNGLYTGLASEVAFYNRYADRSCAAIPVVAYLAVEPSAYFRWKGYGFDTGITAAYSFGTEFTELAYKNGHRAEFSIDLQWKNDFVKLYGIASAVVGNHLLEKPVIVPFTAGVDVSVPVSFSDRCLGITAEGGIKSYKPHIYELEEKFKFSEINFNPSETSDWYGKLAFVFPFRETFTAKASVEYYKTAYDNGTWQSDLSKTVNGLYCIRQKEHQLLVTDFALSYTYEIFSISGGWHSNWLDVPALENNHEVDIALNLQDTKERWGVMVEVLLQINSDFGVPVLNAEAFVKLSPSVKAAVNVNDIIKLYKGETRTYAGKYVGRGGSAALLLKFIF